MLLALGGIPKEFFESLQHIQAKVFPGTAIVALPLSESGRGEYRINPNHGEALRASLEAHAEKFPASIDDGVGVLLVCREFDDTTQIARLFFPSCLTLRIHIPHPLPMINKHRRRVFDELVPLLRKGGESMRRATRAMVTEASERLKRTPLLLPLRNFQSDTLSRSITTLFHQLPLDDNPNQLIARECAAIETEHPHNRTGSRPHFTSSAGIRFNSPGRDLHGRLWENHGPYHGPVCKLNGLLRLGARIRNGFHYDCDRERGELQGDFQNCHDEIESLHGKPHINIAPNDALRGPRSK